MHFLAEASHSKKVFWGEAQGPSPALPRGLTLTLSLAMRVRAERRALTDASISKVTERNTVRRALNLMKAGELKQRIRTVTGGVASLQKVLARAVNEGGVGVWVGGWMKVLPGNH